MSSGKKNNWVALKASSDTGSAFKKIRSLQQAPSESPEPTIELPFEAQVVPSARELNTFSKAEQRLIQKATERMNLVHLFSGGVIFRLSGQEKIPGLPENYFFKGGVARELLRSLLFGSSKSIPVRDRDLVRFVYALDSQDHELSLQHMAEDYEFGRGVEVVENIAIYLASRDLTVNEVLARKGWLVCSFDCLADTLQGVLRPTAHVTDATGAVDGRTYVKAIRILAEALHFGVTYRIAEISKLGRLTPFDVGLHLDRAFAVSDSIAREYILQLWSSGVLHQLFPLQYDAPPEPSELVYRLSKQIKGEVTFFKNLSPATLRDLVSRRG